MNRWLGVSAFLAILLWNVANAADYVTLVEDGSAKVSIVIANPAKVIDTDAAKPTSHASKREAARMLQWAAEDLTNYLHRMSGADITVSDAPIEGLTPIYIGHAPDDITLPATSKYGDAYLIDATPDRIILLGESERSTYYAAARLLHQLGIRWYAPGELGEFVPASKTLRLAIGQTASTPDYHTRNLWGQDAQEHRWLLRNRMGGPQMPQGHAFADFQRPLDDSNASDFFKNHPDFFPIMDGEVRRYQANLSNPELHKHFAEHIRRRLDRGTRWAGGMGEGIGPDDGPIIDERPESQGFIRGRRDPMMQLPDATDLFVHYANGIARELEDEYADHRLGFYVYSNHAGAPIDEQPHKMLFPIIAPITFSRYSSIGNPRVPTSMLLQDIIKRWTTLSEDVGFYLYNFNLADAAMPFTRTLAFSKDIPELHAMGIRYGSIESMPNWHTMVPGNYVLANLMWDVHANPTALADEVYTNYFGPASDAMREYNHILEQAYENTDAQAGSLWAMHRILNPQVISLLDATLRQAERAASEQAPFADRVKVMRHSFTFAKRWLAARAAMNEFQFTDAAAEAEKFLTNYKDAHASYPLYFTKDIERYFNGYHMPAFKDAQRVEEEGRILYKFPDSWKAYFDENRVGHRMGLGDPRSLASNWIDLKTYSATIDEQGFPHFRGLIWYRHEFDMPAVQARVQTNGLFGPPTNNASSDKIMLWFGGIDTTAHIYINGENLGQHTSRNFGPVEIDITKAIRVGARNTIIIAVDNSGIMELGTGGIMRPAVIYQPR